MPESLRTKKAMSNVLALILAGGEGERLSPLAVHRARAAVPTGGTYRIADSTPGNCSNWNVAILQGAKRQ